MEFTITITKIMCACCGVVEEVEAMDYPDDILYWLPDDWEFDDKTKKFYCPIH